jgi:uncharacterized protein (TIGR02145 family)
MRTRFHAAGLGCLLLLFITYSCKKEEVPTVKTYETRNVMATVATSGGRVTDAGSDAVNARGVCWSTTSNPTISDSKTSDGTGVGDFDSQITGLSPATTYYVRAYATNGSGTGYGEVLSFKTAGTVPKATSLQPLMICGDEATLSANVNPCLVTSTVSFEYGQTAGYGNSIDYTKNLYYADQKIAIRISGLTPGTTYHFRVKAVNSLGTSYGEDMIFQTTQPVADIDGNMYNTLTIGSQTWTSRNLETTRFNDGTEIPLVTDDASWSELYYSGSPAFCWYNNDESQSKGTYGALYNWYTVNHGNLCPVGYHVPTYAEWFSLMSSLDANMTYFGGSMGMTMATDTGWAYFDTNAAIGNTDYPEYRNITRFSVLPAGIRDANLQVFRTRGTYSIFWTSTEADNLESYSIGFGYDQVNVIESANIKAHGFSVRCLKD